jgi:PKD repeat protein
MENVEGRKFCGECGTTLEALLVRPVTPPIQQTSPVATAPRASFSLSERTKKRLMVGAIAIAAILVIGAALGYLYYYQPVRGSGTVSTTTIDAGQTVQFGFTPSQGVSPYQYSWDFGDGGVSSEQNPSHSYNSPGTYRPIVTVSSTAGETTTWTTTIIVNPHPSVEGTVSPSVGVNSLNVSFTAHAWGGTPDFSYSWLFGDGTSSDVQSPTHHYSLGKYTATVTVRDGAGMTASWSVYISVNLPLAIGAIVKWIGPGDTESFTCTPSQGVPPYSFYWEFGEGLSSTLQNFTYDYGHSGTTTVYLTVTDSVGEIAEFQKLIEY